MNKNITEEELLLRKRARRRLVGAIVLVVAAIIILPMIFDEPKPDAETHEIDIHLFPKEDITEIPPLVLPSETPPPLGNINETIDQAEFSSALSPDFSDVLQPLDQVYDANENDENIVKSHIPIPGIKPRFEIAQTVHTKQQLSQASDQYVVQLGAFSDKTKAQQHLNNLKSNGFRSVYTETHMINGNVVTRVRIGPFSNRNVAELELEKLKRLGLDGVVTPR